MIAVIASKYISIPFRFAGIECFFAESEEEVLKTFEEIKNNFQIILVEEKFFEKVLSKKEGKYPIISAIPSLKEFKNIRKEKIYELIKKAIGFEIKSG